jgi:tetratricopeptide (TPR) repeat protein
VKHYPLTLLVVLITGCASVPGGAPAVEQVDAVLAAHARERTAIQAGEAVPLTDVSAAHPGTQRSKTSTSGAELAEQWSPALGAAVARHAADPTVRSEVELAQVYRDAGILDQAYDHYEAATRLNPREAAAWDGLARIWRDWGYPGLGLGDAHRAVWADPSSPVARNTLGTILQLLGKTREARDQFARAVALDPGAAYAHYNLAMVYVGQQQYVAAAEAFERAAAIDPSLEIALVRARQARHQALDAAAGKGGSHERR